MLCTITATNQYHNLAKMIKEKEKKWDIWTPFISKFNWKGKKKMKARGRNPSTQKVYKNEPPRAKDREKEK